jgi:hypothetical protein
VDVGLRERERELKRFKKFNWEVEGVISYLKTT